MSRLRRSLGSVWWWIRYRPGRSAFRLRKWIDPLAGTDIRRYKTAREIALENTAAELDLDLDAPYVEEWEVPVEGVDYPAFDLTPEMQARLDAWGAEMSLYLERQHAIRQRRKGTRRRRIGALVASSLLVLGCVGAGANALGLDVPVIHEAVDLLVAGRETPRSPRAVPGSVDPPRIQRGRTSARIEVPVSEGPGLVSAVAFQAHGPQICFRLADTAPGAVVDQAITGCWPFTRLRLLEGGDVAAVTSITIADTTVITGFASADVRTIRGRGPDASIRVAISHPWTPDPQALPGFRAFIGVTQIDTGRDGLDITEEARARDLSIYKLRAELEDGRTVNVRR